MGEECGKGVTFICHQGLERSRAVSEALSSKLGVNTRHFHGGTQRLSWLSEEEIKSEIGDGPVTLIYDQGSSDREYMNKEKALSKLRQAGINPTIASTADIAACLHENGLDINDFLF